MKKHFVVSLVRGGLLGGAIVADEDAITYRTGKVTVPSEYRNLEMKYEDISEVALGWLLVLPTVMVKMRNGNEYKFAMFFNRKGFVEILREKGVNV